MKTFLKTILIMLFASALSLSAEEPTPPAPDQQLSSLITGLGAEKFETREESQAKLIELGKKQYDLIIRNCVESFKENKDPEIRARLKTILRTLVLEKNFRKKGFVGISMANSGEQIEIENGKYNPVNIVNVVPDFPADKNGFMTGDQILKIDDKSCGPGFQSNDIVEYISAKKPGTKLKFLLISENKPVTRELEITERPELPGEPKVEELQDAFFNKWFKENLKSQEKQQQKESAQ
ncbi:MAG TPA: hypothetical protein DCZ94_19675 [Lentisphaeria bacterium]|nr:MAG: hypothetical protein A2X48_22485 [Lentisphaerae bacterium GWF2_49_21]HBC89165.1 hypothetical protein [Lentisphaeria bacterium]